MLYVLLTVCFLISTVFAEDCIYKNYYIEHKNVVEGRNIATFPTNNLDECAKKCSQTHGCDAANFLLNAEDDAMCMLVDTSEATANSLTPLPASVVYSLRQFCMEKKDDCIRRQWAFEKHEGYDTLDEKFILGELSGLTLEQCLNTCVRSKHCEAALFNKEAQTCRLSKVSLNNVNSIKQHFGFSDNVDLYESNCIKRRFDTRHCGFVRINQAGFVDIFDIRIEKIKDLSQCESICLDWRFGVCRAYTYNKKSKQCYISHNGQRATGRSVLETIDDNLAYGELDDCVNFELDCRAKSVRLVGNSFRLFKGFIRTRKGKQTICERNITESYSFEAIFGFDECGIQRTKKSAKIYSGLIMIKEGSTDLITIHDKMVEIKCKIHEAYHDSQPSELQYHFRIQEPNSSFLLSDEKKPKALFESVDDEAQFRLEVLDKNGAPAQVVEPGEDGFLLITLDGTLNSESKFIVSDLVAEDDKDMVKLIDSDGCVANSTLVTSLERPANNQLRIGVKFGGFPEQSQVTYHTLGKICHAECDLQCNNKFYIKNNQTITNISDIKLGQRRRRDVPNNIRKFSLAEDVYEVYGKHPVRLQRREILPNVHVQFDKNFDEMMNDKELERVINELEESSTTKPKSNKIQARPLPLGCFSGDLNCMFTITMAVLQFFLMISCTCIVYSVVRKWLRYYKNRGRRMSQMPPEISRFSDAEPSGISVSQSDLTAPSSRPTSSSTVNPNAILVTKESK
ncbi:unnamed protein product [Bursaphelenchus xylophilus]|uniref:(pine wood nematode) hypothetical protein n=1 Tax=Bursaphelenchus xylophilus TaxID=6326 RepID=A0A1I7S4P8_BURXY|nr:unnamed protein product [Bursaphelenchus xylophilus]CAG9117283.1 unnamed protein product [Bursaphelenchus xylophilus]